jgi:protein Tex
MTNIQFIAKSVNTTSINIQNTVQLLEEDCTIPFISRYRKDKTGNLDEVQIEQIAKFQKEYEFLVKRKEAILKSIEEQNGLTPELDKKIQQSLDLQELEDFYLPFKKKKKNQS